MVFCLVGYKNRFFKIPYLNKETLAEIIADRKNPKAKITIYSANVPGFIADGREKEVALEDLDPNSIIEKKGTGR